MHIKLAHNCITEAAKRSIEHDIRYASVCKPSLYHTCHAVSALTLTLLDGRQEGHLAYKKTEWWGNGVVIGLEWCANDLHKHGPADPTATSLSLAPI